MNIINYTAARKIVDEGFMSNSLFNVKALFRMKGKDYEQVREIMSEISPVSALDKRKNKKQQGEPLAEENPEDTFEIEKEKDNLVQMPSIFLILKKNSEDKSGMEIDMMNDRIGISLYKTEYEQYSILSKGIFQPLLHSSVIFPTLIYVFENMKNSDLETFEEYSWFKTIKKVLANMNIELNRETLEREFSYDLAQKIINFPVSRSFNAMMELEQSEEEIV